MMTQNVAVFVGSLRKESLNRKVAMALQTLAPASLKLEIVEIGQLPVYNQDFDDGGSPPKELPQFRQHVLKFDALLFVTPEYNRSVPAVLKNALDVGSRPWGKNVWDGKPGAVISVTVGPSGAFGANHHLRQTLVTLNVPCMPQPEAYISDAMSLFDANGNFASGANQEIFKNFMAAFATWVGTNAIAKREQIAA